MCYALQQTVLQGVLAPVLLGQLAITKTVGNWVGNCAEVEEFLDALLTLCLPLRPELASG